MAIRKEGCSPTDHKMSRSIRSGLILLVPVLLAFAGMHGRAELPAAQGLRVAELAGRPGTSVSAPNRPPTGIGGRPSTIRSWTASSRGPTGTTSRSSRPACGSCKPAPSWASRSARSSRRRSRPSGPSSTTARATEPPPARCRSTAAASRTGSRQIGAQASWELDFWGRIRRGIQSADASLLATLADYDNTLVTLTADVANTYIALRTAEERIRIAQENIDIQEQTLKIVEARFTYGTVTQLDVEQARTVLLNTLRDAPDPRDAATPGAGCPQRAARHAAERSRAICWTARPRSRSRRRRSSWASRPICCAAGRTSGAPSCRRSRSRPRSEWPRPISSPPSP